MQSIYSLLPSGAGKSSVLALLLRFYDPQAGKVLIDGKDIQKYNLRWLRTHIGLVQQEPLLFNCSIRDNICYGNNGASESEIVEVAKEANIHEFVSDLPLSAFRRTKAKNSHCQNITIEACNSECFKSNTTKGRQLLVREKNEGVKKQSSYIISGF